MGNKSLTIWVMVVGLCLINSPEAFAACPSADLTGDCFVDFEDFAIIGNQWLNVYDWNDVNTLANQWLTSDPCVPDDMVYIPDGEFDMGDHHDGMINALPIHTVTLDSFYMSKYEITNQQYCDYLNSAYPSQIKVDGGSGIVYASSDDLCDYPYCDTHSYDAHSQIDYSGGVFSVNIKDGTTDMSNHPMVELSWYGAVAYCNWKSQQGGLERCYNLSTWECDFTKDGYRLPTEAQWEYAARGGENSPYYRYPWGNTIDGSMANYEGSGDPYETGAYPWTSPVGYYDGGQTPTGTDMANGYGLYDVAGNVYEWCNDWYDAGYYSVSPTNNPTGPASGSYRVLRGGYWYYNVIYCRVAIRIYIDPDLHYDYGFRVVLGLNN